MNTTTRVPMAGYCAICERPAVELIIRDDRRTIVHSGLAAVCTLPHPATPAAQSYAPRAPLGCVPTPEHTALRTEILGVFGDGRPRTLREVRAATVAERSAVDSQVRRLHATGQLGRSWRKRPGVWQYWPTDTARKAAV